MYFISILIFCSSFSGIVLCNESQNFKEQIAIEGSSYKMKCEDAIGKNQEVLTYIVIWSVNGHLPRGPKYKMLTDGLVIRNVTKDDTFFNYTCTVLDRLTFRSMGSANIKLRLRQRSGKSLDSANGHEVQEKRKVWGVLKQWVTLPCNVFSRPSPFFEWKKLETGEIIMNSSDIYNIVENEFTSNLSISLHNASFFGEYVCTASNVHGESKQYFNLTEGYKPKPPFVYPTYIGRNSLTVKIEPQEVLRTESIKDTLPNTYYYIQYTEEANASPITSGHLGISSLYHVGKKWTTVINTIGTFELKNLKKNTTYMVRCAVANVVAISDYSSAVRITTDADEPESLSALNHEDKLIHRNEQYGRSTNNLLENLESSQSISSALNPATCKTPRYKKTIIRTVTSTILIENLLENNTISSNDTSPLVNKRVEESTLVEREFLCDI